ncbi:MAG: arginase family protein [Candidatus Bathyarchaeota archaeon]|nr:arginase family protein [Candidatus Bathyarchaeota archaeon]
MVENLRVAIDKFPYNGQYGFKENGIQVDSIEQGGLPELLKKKGCTVAEVFNTKLTTDEEKQYGEMHRMGLASKHLADAVSAQLKAGMLPLGLLHNCNGLMGMLAGVQHSGGWKPIKVGLVWIDAHGDFNTPETTYSGMLGGMPVAVSCGLCYDRLRRTCGLDPALPPKYVTMVGVRDTDPYEQDAIDRHDIAQITVEDLKGDSPAVDMEMERLSVLCDKIYVHVDMDVLDPADIPGAGLPVANGPTAKELGEAIEVMFEYPKTAAFGVASYPAARDTEKKGLKSVYTLIEGAIKGAQGRVD